MSNSIKPEASLPREQNPDPTKISLSGGFKRGGLLVIERGNRAGKSLLLMDEIRHQEAIQRLRKIPGVTQYLRKEGSTFRLNTPLVPYSEVPPHNRYRLHAAQTSGVPADHVTLDQIKAAKRDTYALLYSYHLEKISQRKPQ